MDTTKKPCSRCATRASRFIPCSRRSAARSTTVTMACGAGSETSRRHGEAIYGSSPRPFFDLANHTLMFGVQHGRGPQSGAEVAMPATAVAGWREGLCVSHKAFVHREDALRELGVSEDALEPIAP